MKTGGAGRSRLLKSLLGLLILGAIGYLTWHFLGRPSADEIKDWGNFTDIVDDLGDEDFIDFWDEDPFVGDNNTHAWKTSGENGLDLVLLNVLDDSWQEEFQLAAYDWENGEPDALTLKLRRRKVDYSCKPVKGLMKVCNGNYGETGYLGVNEMILFGGYIQTSVAKMNEYYLFKADKITRQYTMCHEIGHGFGLPHTDENFKNADLGNCLDYTHRPENNLHPDETNFKRLAEVYGTVNRRLAATQEKSLRERKSYTPELLTKYDAAITELEEALKEPHKRNKSGWRRLKAHSHGTVYIRKLDEKYTLKVQMLYKFPN